MTGNDQTRKDETIDVQAEVKIDEEPRGPSGAGMADKEIEAGKTFALLSYLLGFVGIPFFVVPLITRDNGFALYHAKQAALVWIVTAIGGALAGFVSILLTLVCIGYVIGPLLALAITVFWIWLNVQGAINAGNGICKPLPLTGDYAEQWFKGLTKKTETA